MAPGKLKLTFIGNDSKRKNVCKKRKQSLLKKTEELSMLCGVEACAIVYGPDDPRPVIWPSELGVENVLRMFMSMPHWEQSKKMVNQESFIAQSIMKSKEKLQKIVKENKDIEMSLFMAHCFKTGMFQPDINMTTADMNVLSSIIEQNLKDIDKRMEMLKANQVIPNQPDVETSTLQPQIMHTLTYQPPMQTFSFQPRIQIPEFQTQIQTPEFPTQTYQSKMQTQTFQPQMQSPALFQPRMQSLAFFQPQIMQTPSYQPQIMQTPSYQPQIMQTPSYQPHMQTPALEDMTLLNYGNGSGMQMQQFNGNGYETTMLAFGGANFPL
ncbi:Agamous-like MADS-box protein AGL80 [Glycine soja]|uniref:Agamous-like MADS-box protein AGL80 n=1 Tax=Glycine soja TaxID=3848 RepID=A0A0B2PWH7_GLYSO|nr:Agamous-like MADS-box protein AGL80 [Glycine soja]